MTNRFVKLVLASLLLFQTSFLVYAQAPASDSPAVFTSNPNTPEQKVDWVAATQSGVAAAKANLDAAQAAYDKHIKDANAFSHDRNQQAVKANAAFHKYEKLKDKLILTDLDSEDYGPLKAQMEAASQEYKEQNALLNKYTDTETKMKGDTAKMKAALDAAKAAYDAAVKELGIANDAVNDLVEDSKRGKVLPEAKVGEKQLSISDCLKVSEVVNRGYADFGGTNFNVINLVANRGKFSLEGIGEISDDDILGCAIQTGDVKLWMIPFYIRFILEFVVNIAGLIAVGGFIYGGYLYLFAGLGDQKEKGKEAIKNSVIGLVLIMTSWAIVNIVISIVTI